MKPQVQNETAGRTDLSGLNLIHVVRQYAPMIGGLEDFVKNLAKRQLGRLESVKVITLNRLFTDPAHVLPERDVIDGVEVIRIPFSGSSRYPFAPQVFRHLGEADLVHVHAVDFFFDALALTRVFHGHKMVATTHGGFFHTKAHSRLKTAWFNSLTRLSAHQYGGIACCSESDLEMFASIAPKQSRLIENGVDLGKFSTASSPVPKRQMVTIGRFSQNKRLDRILDVLKVLVHDGEDWRLDIIGSPSDLSRGDLASEISRRGLEASVGVHTGLSDQDVRKVIGNSSLFVSASEYEGFGIAMIEALSAGLLPVVQPNAAFVSLQKRHPLVRLADFAQAEVTATAVREAMAQLERSSSIRSEAMRSAEQHGWPATVHNYDLLYRDVLGV